MSVIGDNIKALRSLHGLTQQELADIIGVTRETVNKWETGSIGNVRTSNLNVLRQHFSLSVDDLRSESCGLAARARQLDSAATQETHVPVMGSPDATIELPTSIASRHPRAFAFPMEDDSMARALPKGSLAIVDPDISPNNDTIVLADLPGAASPVLRRMHTGATKALLSAEGYERHEEDVVIDLDDLNLRGVVVWYQAPAELG